MLFNSFEFLLFFPVVVIGYYIVGGVNFRVIFGYYSQVITSIST